MLCFELDGRVYAMSGERAGGAGTLQCGRHKDAEEHLQHAAGLDGGLAVLLEYVVAHQVRVAPRGSRRNVRFTAHLRVEPRL
jgi:hypothetical protein